MPELSSQWAAAMEPNIKKYTVDGYAEHPDLIGMVAAVTDDSSGIIRLRDAGGPRIIPKGTEGATSTEVTTSDAYESVASPQIFKAKMAVTEEDARRLLYPEILDKAKQLGSGAIQTLNIYAAQTYFIQGFTSTNTFYGDGEELYSTVHTRSGGSTWSNANSSGNTLTEANLETDTVALQQQPSFTGKKLAIGGGNLKLIAPEQLAKESIIITGSTLRSGTANNDINVYKGKHFVLIHPFIGSDITDLDGNTGSDTAWFLQADGQHGLEFVYEVRPMTKTWEDQDADVLYNKIYFSCKPIWNHPRGIQGSAGDGAAYSS
jgi:hypothetical protein